MRPLYCLAGYVSERNADIFVDARCLTIEPSNWSGALNGPFWGPNDQHCISDAAETMSILVCGHPMSSYIRGEMAHGTLYQDFYIPHPQGQH